MSHIVKNSDLEHIFGNRLDFLRQRCAVRSEEDINNQLQRLADPNGVNVLINSDSSRGSFMVNYRIIAERSGEAPATRIFLRSHSQDRMVAIAYDCRFTKSINLNGEGYDQDFENRSLLIQAATANLLALSIIFNPLPTYESEPFHCLLHTSDPQEVEKIKEFFDGHPDLLPKLLRGEIYPELASERPNTHQGLSDDRKYLYESMSTQN